MVALEMTSAERKAVEALHKIAKQWPKSLWLFSASGSLCVTQKRGGKRMETLGGGYDEDYEVATISIENDGGDW